MARSGGGFWKGVFLVILVEVVVGGCLALVVVFGGFPMGADAHASKLEATVGGWTHDSWVSHHAPHEADPVPVNDHTLMEGAALYQGNCAVCHGGANYRKSPLGKGIYPGAPQFVQFADFQKSHPNKNRHQGSPAQQEARNDHSFFVVKHGIRFTGMPAWKYNMTDTQIWEVVNFLHHMSKLPPDVDQAWQQMSMSPIAAPAPPPPTKPAKPGKAGKKK